MNAPIGRIILIGGLLLPGVALAQPQAAADVPSLYHLTPNYHGVQRLDESLVSPFRKPEVRAAQAASIAQTHPTGPNTSAVLAKFNSYGLTGVIPSTSKTLGVIILGDCVFKEGDELTFPKNDSQGTAPLLDAHRVILESVTREGLSLDVSILTEKDVHQKLPVGLMDFDKK